MKGLNKTDFIQFLNCPESIWLLKNKSNIYYKGDFSLFLVKLINEGYEVEGYAKKIFPGGVEVPVDSSLNHTKRLLRGNNKIFFQPSFNTSTGAYARVDILEKVNKNSYHLYEVKSSTSIKKDKRHNQLKDVCFQKFVLQECGLKITKTFIIHLNKDFVKKGEINPKELLEVIDVSNEVDEIYSTVVNEINSALNYINKNEINENECSCKRKTRSNHCDSYEYFNKDLPEYNIYQLRNIREKKLNELISLDCEDLIDIPTGFDLSDYQKFQIMSAVNHKPVIHTSEIKTDLNNLKYPLHFFDYETYSSAVPKVDGLGPHDKLTFQVSIHTLTKDGSLTHFEFLSDKMDFSPDLVEGMKKFTGLTGTFISWHASFEIGRNNDMKDIMPNYNKYFDYINTNMFDLEVIFKDDYVDYRFKGSSSLKKVLPIICPKLSYSDENIQDGTMAMETWGRLVSQTDFDGNIDFDVNQEQTRADLLSYCKKDTFAMVEILKQLSVLD